jgi:prepilin-type N-terminal cleavage/methylation domain-containing protein
MRHAPVARLKATFLKQNLGFSLAELMICLGVMGVIAALTVPSMLNAVELSKMKAVGKESLNTIQNILNQNFNTGEQPTDYWTYLRDHLNAAKVCPVGQGAVGTPCFTYQGDTATHERLILQNGAMISFSLEDVNSLYLCLRLTSTLRGPAAVGANSPQGFLRFNKTDAPIAASGFYTEALKPGQLGPYSTTTDIQAWYDWLMS